MTQIKLTKEEYLNLPIETKKRSDLTFYIITKDKKFYDSIEFKHNVLVFYSEGFYKNYVKNN